MLGAGRQCGGRDRQVVWWEGQVVRVVGRAGRPCGGRGRQAVWWVRQDKVTRTAVDKDDKKTLKIRDSDTKKSITEIMKILKGK